MRKKMVAFLLTLFMFSVCGCSNSVDKPTSLPAVSSTTQIETEPDSYVEIAGNRYSVQETTKLELRSEHMTYQDIKPIQQLANLESLELYCEELEDIAPVTELQNLKSLTISSENLITLNPLAGLTNLTELSLDLGVDSYDKKYDFAFLANLNNLKELTLWDCAIGNTELQQISQATSLESFILASNGYADITDISSLQNLSNLKFLTLGSITKATGIASLNKLTNLETLYFEGGALSALPSMPNLSVLGCRGHHVDHRLSAQFPSLKEFSVDLDDVDTDLSYLSNYPTLNKLSLRHGKLSNSNIASVGKLSNLTNLQIFDCGATDFSFLSSLNNLKVLEIYNSPIADLTPIQQLADLEALSLDYCSISDVSFASGLKNLKYLSLTNNDIKEISPLFNLNGLEVLDLKDNKGLLPSQKDIMKDKNPNCSFTTCDITWNRDF